MSASNSFGLSDGREAKGAQTRADLRGAAEALIVEVGLEAVTGKAVAERAGISRGAMLHHYPTRDDLIIHTARHFWQRAKDFVDRQAEDLTAGQSDVDTFIRVLYQNVFRAAALITMLDFMVLGRTDTRVGIAVTDILTDLFQVYEALGIKALARFGVSPVTARVTITLIVSTLRGLRIYNNIAPDEAKVKAVLDMLTAAITRSIQAGAGSEPAGMEWVIALRAEQLTKRFGGVDVVDRVLLQVEKGQVLGLIGPNGAGKTTMFNMLSGVVKPDGGKIFIGGRDATGLPPHRLARLGIVRTFQHSRELDRLSVLDNVMLAARDNPGERLGAALFRPGATQLAERALTGRAREILALVSLSSHEGTSAGSLSGGQKKLLELARSLMAGAETILLDEIAAGVAPHLVEEITAMIRKLNADFGTTFLIIEHNMGFIRELTSRVAVMAAGRLLAEGRFEDVSGDPAVIESYLGQAA